MCVYPQFQNNFARGSELNATRSSVSYDIFLKVLEFHTTLRGVVVDGQSFEDFCHRIPVADITLAKKKKRRRKRQAQDETFPYNGTDPASQGRRYKLDQWTCSSYTFEGGDGEYEV